MTILLLAIVYANILQLMYVIDASQRSQDDFTSDSILWCQSLGRSQFTRLDPIVYLLSFKKPIVRKSTVMQYSNSDDQLFLATAKGVQLKNPAFPNVKHTLEWRVMRLHWDGG